jgi:pyrimidine-nucleoside phosphorylase
MATSKREGQLASPVELIRKKRDGGALEPAEIDAFIREYLDERITDYQMSAFLMAVFWRGLTSEETLALTRAMLNSGDTLELKRVRAPKVDKHSTGGVGDKITLPLAPLVAACGAEIGRATCRERVFGLV